MIQPISLIAPGFAPDPDPALLLLPLLESVGSGSRIKRLIPKFDPLIPVWDHIDIIGFFVDPGLIPVVMDWDQWGQIGRRKRNDTEQPGSRCYCSILAVGSLWSVVGRINPLARYYPQYPAHIAVEAALADAAAMLAYQSLAAVCEADVANRSQLENIPGRPVQGGSTSRKSQALPAGVRRFQKTRAAEYHNPGRAPGSAAGAGVAPRPAPPDQCGRMGHPLAVSGRVGSGRVGLGHQPETANPCQRPASDIRSADIRYSTSIINGLSVSLPADPQPDPIAALHKRPVRQSTPAVHRSLSCPA